MISWLVDARPFVGLAIDALQGGAVIATLAYLGHPAFKRGA